MPAKVLPDPITAMDQRAWPDGHKMSLGQSAEHPSRALLRNTLPGNGRPRRNGANRMPEIIEGVASRVGQAGKTCRLIGSSPTFGHSSLRIGAEEFLAVVENDAVTAFKLLQVCRIMCQNRVWTLAEQLGVSLGIDVLPASTLWEALTNDAICRV